MLRAVLVLIIAAALPAAAAAQEPVRVDPMVRVLQLPGVAAELRANAPIVGADQDPASRVLGGTVSVFRDAPGAEPMVGVFVRVQGPATLAALEARGVRVGSVIGRLATARVPLTVLPELETLAGVATVDVARVLTLSHDSSMRAIGLDGLRAQVDGVWSGATGAGVLIGVIDTGLDLTHPDFLDAAGQTRVDAVWVQTQGGNPPPGFNYGRVCERAEIQRVAEGFDSVCPQRDALGHGTHVTGTAAGDGSAVGTGGTAYQYAGVAPAAELLIVNGWFPGFSEDRIVDGLVWLRDRARTMGRPIVVNLSLGGQTGPHDGTLPIEEAIDLLSEPGFIVVSAGGNEGSNGNATPLSPTPNIHARGYADPGSATSWTLEVLPYIPAYRPSIVQMQLWHDGRDPLTVTVVRPDGTAVSAGVGQTVEEDAANGQIFIRNTVQSTHPAFHRAIEIWLSDRGESGQVAAGNWTIRVSAAAAASGSPYDLWIYRDLLASGPVAFGRAGFDNRYVVGSPGTATRAITAGAFASRVCWPRNGGVQSCYTERETVGDLARFSAAGPTRDGRMKPEIVAPGLAVMSAAAGGVGFHFVRVAPDGVHVVAEGTSMATPHVAGAIALLLERRPTLTPEDVKAIFSMAARQDEFTTRVYDGGAGGRPSDWWGFGKLDVRAALALLEGDITVTRLDLTPAASLLPLGASIKLRADTYGSEGEPAFAQIAWSSLEPEVATVNAVGVVQTLGLGHARVVASAGGMADTVAFEVVAAGVLSVQTADAHEAAPAQSRAGSVIGVQALTLSAVGIEAIDVHALAFDFSSGDPAAELALYRDTDQDGQLDPGETRLVAREVEGTGTQRVVLRPPTLRVGVGATVRLIVAVEASGASPIGSRYRVELVPEESRSVALVSGARNAISTSGLLSAEVATTVLGQEQSFSLSENPVRGERLLLNFSERPTELAVYTASGRRVRDLLPALASDQRAVWDLTDDDGRRVTPAVYLLVARVGAEVHRVKLFVLTRSTGGVDQELVHVP
ncbi:MAG: S8 family serine peptidase [Gemmatimonadota bacterium]